MFSICFLGRDIIELPIADNSTRTKYVAYQMLEDEYWCSGMCRAGLFYFSKNI